MNCMQLCGDIIGRLAILFSLPSSFDGLLLYFWLLVNLYQLSVPVLLDELFSLFVVIKLFFTLYS